MIAFQRTILVLSFFTALAFVGCKTLGGSSSSKGYVGKEFVSESGLRYTIHKAGEGTRAQVGDMVKVHYAGRLKDSTEFDNSFKRGEPIKFQLGKGRVIKGWEEGIALLNVGDSATLVIPPHLGYGNRKMGPIPPNSELTFEVVLVDVVESAKPWDVTGKDTVQLKNGLQIIWVERNENAPKADIGMRATVHYSGFMKNWKKFDSSVDKGAPFSFVIGRGMVIKGWDFGVAEMRVGDKARLIIAPELAYGARGKGSIPPNTTLYFDVELLKVQ